MVLHMRIRQHFSQIIPLCYYYFFWKHLPWFAAPARHIQWHQLHTLAMSSSKISTSVASPFQHYGVRQLHQPAVVEFGIFFVSHRSRLLCTLKNSCCERECKKKLKNAIIVLSSLVGSVWADSHRDFCSWVACIVRTTHPQKFIIINLWMPFVIYMKG